MAISALVGLLVAIGGFLTPLVIVVGSLGALAAVAPVSAIGLLSGVPFLFNLGKVSAGGVADIRLLQVLWLAAFVGCLLQSAVGRPVASWRMPWTVVSLAVLLVGIELVSAIASKSAHSLVQVVQTAYLTMIAYLTARVWGTSNSGQWRKWLGFSGVALLVFTVISLAGYLVPWISLPYYTLTVGPGISLSRLAAVSSALTTYGIPRFSLFGVGPTGSASVFIASLGVSAGIAVGDRTGSRSGLAATVAVVSAVGLLLTLSRAGWLIGALMGAWFALRIGARRIVPIAVLLAVAVASLLFVPSLASRFADITNTQEGSVLSHQRLYETAVVMAERKPLLGYGPGQFAEVASQLGVGDQLGVNIDAIDAHNFVLQEAAEVGVLGAFIQLSFVLAVLFWSEPRVRAKSSGLYGIFIAAVGVLLMGLTMNIFRTEVLWCLLGVLIGVAGATLNHDNPLFEDRTA